MKTIMGLSAVLFTLEHEPNLDEIVHNIGWQGRSPDRASEARSDAAGSKGEQLHVPGRPRQDRRGE